MIRNALVVTPFNAKLEDGCDYALQTIKILGRTNSVVGVLLGNPYTWGDFFKELLTGKSFSLVSKTSNRTWLVKPFMLIPGQRWMVIKKTNTWLFAWLLKLAVQFKVFNVGAVRGRVLWFFEPFFAPLFLRVFHDYESVYDCVDRYHPLGVEAQKSEATVKHLVDHMTVISEPLKREHSRSRADIVKVPLGFDSDTFSAFARRHRIKQLSLKNKKKFTIGFCGGINYRFDFPLLFTLIAQHPQHTFWFVGPLQLTLIPSDTETAKKVERLLAFPNVKWTPPVPKNQMPQIISEMDVCLIPYDVKKEFNRYCHPMKGAEYLFMGKPTITTPIEELTHPFYKNLLLIGNNAAAFARHIGTVQRSGWSSATRRHQRVAALSQSWAAKVEAVTQVLTTI